MLYMVQYSIIGSENSMFFLNIWILNYQFQEQNE